MSPFRQLFLASGLLGALLVASCGGDSSGPAFPFVPTSLGDTRQNSTTGATISGTARLAGSRPSVASLMTAHEPSVLMVRVVGTAIGAAVDASGRFLLQGVPPGDVQLHFEGSGINATLILPSVQSGQTVTIVVLLAGNSALLESQSSTGSKDGDSKDEDSKDEDSKDDESKDGDSKDDESKDDDSKDDESKDDDSKDDESKDDDSKDDDKSKDK